MNQLPELPTIFGEIIAEARARAGLSQEQVAGASGASNVFISLLETGKRQPSLTSAILLAWSLGIPPDELVRRVVLKLGAAKVSQKPLRIPSCWEKFSNFSGKIEISPKAHFSPCR